MSKFLLLSLKKYDIEINGSIYLGDFFYYGKAGLVQDIYYKFWVWDVGLEIRVTANKYVHICVDFNGKKKQHFIFSLEVPNSVNVTSEFQDSQVIRCISLNCSKSLYCFISVNFLEKSEFGHYVAPKPSLLLLI